MDIRQLASINVAAIVLAIVAIAFGWLYMQEQFFWAITAAVLAIMLAGYLDLRQLILGFVYGGKRPATGGPNATLRQLLRMGNVAAAGVAFLIWAFAWFYMREQFMWAIIVTLYFLVPIVCLNVLLVVYDYFSMRESGKRQLND